LPVQNVEVEEVFSMNEPSTSSEAAIMAASEIAIDDTPRCTYLKRSIRQLSQEMVIKTKKLKNLQQTIRRKNKKLPICKP